MDKIENIVKEYSSKKLKDILEHQSSAYSENFIDFTKDELIRRGESFVFSTDLEKEVSALNDIDLKYLVEKDWNNFHLEYLEIARKEYLKRKLKYEAHGDEKEEEIDQDKAKETEQEEDVMKRYPVLSRIADAYFVLAWIFGLSTVAIVIGLMSEYEKAGVFAVTAFVFGALIVIGSFATSELIKVVIKIEENTRRENEN